MCGASHVAFYGVAHVAYLPDGKVIGLSKWHASWICTPTFANSRNLTRQIAQAVMDMTGAKGAAVVMDAHMCMMMRGVMKQKSDTRSMSLLGEFKTIPRQDKRC